MQLSLKFQEETEFSCVDRSGHCHRPAVYPIIIDQSADATWHYALESTYCHETTTQCYRINWPATLRWYVLTIPTQDDSVSERARQTLVVACSSRSSNNNSRAYSVCQKSDTLLVPEFSTLVRCIIFAIFVYLRIIFIKCLISEPSVVSRDGLFSKMVHYRTLYEKR